MTDYFRHFVVPDTLLDYRDAAFVKCISESIKELQEKAKIQRFEFDFQTLEVFYDERISQFPPRVVVKISDKENNESH